MPYYIRKISRTNTILQVVKSHHTEIAKVEHYAIRDDGLESEIFVGNHVEAVIEPFREMSETELALKGLK